ncbi:MAG: hypothetical protein CEE38_01345 [Planctomycetes bacterium B3_Pla]|nr:MAG: hypothetical protein CEE38_01345 [Planctomycetes bacterium B3_Pla]
METGKPEQTPHEPVISETTQYAAEINDPKFEQQNRMWTTMRWFDGIEKTEAAFYTRFQDLPDEDAAFLMSFYNIAEDRELFRMICKFWDVSISGGMQGTECGK